VLKIGSVKKITENNVPTSVSVATGPACDKTNLYDQTKRGIGKLCDTESMRTSI
jgi:hypothetical protein